MEPKKLTMFSREQESAELITAYIKVQTMSQVEQEFSCAREKTLSVSALESPASYLTKTGASIALNGA
jgi:membrane-bound inhibitor of C-type lysozyme